MLATKNGDWLDGTQRFRRSGARQYCPRSVGCGQSALGVNGKYINPQLSTQQGDLQKHGNLVSIQRQLVQTVEFDVAVTAAKAKGTKGGIGVVVGVIALGSKGHSSTENSSVSRIKFSVAVTLPHGEKVRG